MAELYSIVWIDRILSIHQLIDIWAVSTFWLLWVMLQWIFTYRHMCSFLLSRSLGVEWQGHMATCLTIWWPARLFFPRGLYPFTHPSAVCNGPDFSAFSPALEIIVFLVEWYHYIQFMNSINSRVEWQSSVCAVNWQHLGKSHLRVLATLSLLAVGHCVVHKLPLGRLEKDALSRHKLAQSLIRR